MIQFRTPRRVYGLAVGSFALLVGCSTTTTVIGPPPELAQARAGYSTAYYTAVNGSATQCAAGNLNDAKKSLDRAEAMYRSQPGSTAARSQASVALRHAQIAETNASACVAQAQRAQAQAQQLAATEAELARTRQELTQERCGQEEHQGAAPCPGRARADVIVLPGAALFATGSADISPAAKANLKEIALAIKRAPNRKVHVEGFTESTGSKEINEPLSERRAEAVRTYLVSCGVDPARIQTMGLGSTRQIGDETTPDGRAANRRVRIVIEPSTGVAEPMP